MTDARDYAKEAARRDGLVLSVAAWNWYVARYGDELDEHRYDPDVAGEDAWATIRDEWLVDMKRIAIEPPRSWKEESSRFLEECRPVQQVALSLMGLSVPLSETALIDFVLRVREGERREGDVLTLRLPDSGGEIRTIRIFRGYSLSAYEERVADYLEVVDWTKAPIPESEFTSCIKKMGAEFWNTADEVLRETGIVEETKELAAPLTRVVNEAFADWQVEDAASGQRLARLKDLAGYVVGLSGCDESAAVRFLLCDQPFVLPWITVEIHSSEPASRPCPPPWSQLERRPAVATPRITLSVYTQTVPAKTIREVYLDTVRRMAEGDLAGWAFRSVTDGQTLISADALFPDENDSPKEAPGRLRGTRTSTYRMLDFVEKARSRRPQPKWDQVFREWKETGLKPQYMTENSMRTNYYRARNKRGKE